MLIGPTSGIGAPAARQGAARVTSVVHVITGLDQGGAEGVLVRLVQGRCPRLRVAVVSLTTEGVHGAALRGAGAEVLALNMPRGGVRLGALVALYRFLRRFRPDVVQTWMYHADLLGGVVARLAGCGAVFWSLRNLSLDSSTSSRATRLVMRACALVSPLIPARIVSCSRAAADVHQGFGYDARKFVVIPNGYDLARFRPDPAARARLRAELGLGPEEIVIGCVARWHPHKDHATLLQAFGRLVAASPAPWLLLVGPGMEASNPALVALLERSGVQDRVRLLGVRGDVPAILAALDWHVLSSSAEAFPNVVAESMACGVPNVVTDVGDAAMIVGDCGLVVPPGDVDALTAALVRASSVSADEWAECGRCGRKRIESSFDLDAMVAGYEQTWMQQLSRVLPR